MEPTWFDKWSEEAGLNRKSVMALKKVECTDDRTISLLREEDINRLLGQNELTLGQARLLSAAVHKLTVPATVPLPSDNASNTEEPAPEQDTPPRDAANAPPGNHALPASVPGDNSGDTLTI